MAVLNSFNITVFGSDFDVDSFSREINVGGAKVSSTSKAYPRSPVCALRRGNVGRWSSPRVAYYSENKFADEFDDYLYEGSALVNYIESYVWIIPIYERYKNETTEIWLQATYIASKDEPPAGVFISRELVFALASMGASISTEVLIDESLGDPG